MSQYFLVNLILFSAGALVSSQSRNFCLLPFYFLIHYYLKNAEKKQINNKVKMAF